MTAICLFLLIQNVNALELYATPNKYNSTTFSYTINGSETFYTNNSAFVDDISFYYDAGILRVIIQAPSTVGDRTIHILSNRVFQGENSTYHTSTGHYINTLILKVRDEIVIEDEPEDIINEDCTVKISVIGKAFYGKNMLIHTVDENGKDLVSKVVLSDIVGNSDICETNQPFDGFCQIFIPETTEPPLTLLANKEGCQTGQYIINEIKGQKIIEESEEETPTKTLVIQDLPTEDKPNIIISGTVLDSNGNLITDSTTQIKIIDPSNANLETSVASDGTFKFYSGLIGEYSIEALLDGYNPSPKQTVNIRIPRKDIAIVPFLNGNRVTASNQLYPGTILEIGIFNDNQKVNLDVTSTISYNGNQQDLIFIDGETSINLASVGNYIITIPETEQYLSTELRIEALQGFDMNALIIPIVVIIIIVIIVTIVIKKRNKSKYPELGFAPGESGTRPGPLEGEYRVDNY